MILVEAIKLLGGLSGIASAAFLIYDRFFHDRPLVYLLHEQRFVHLVMSNSSLETIIIENIEITPPGILRVAWGAKGSLSQNQAVELLASPDEVESAQNRTIILQPLEKEWSMVLVNDQVENIKIKIKLYWRNTRYSLPIRPWVSVRTSIQDLRIIREAAENTHGGA